jgi:calcineurin-like phosphoesterase
MSRTVTARACVACFHTHQVVIEESEDEKRVFSMCVEANCTCIVGTHTLHTLKMGKERKKDG